MKKTKKQKNYLKLISIQEALKTRTSFHMMLKGEGGIDYHRVPFKCALTSGSRASQLGQDYLPGGGG